MMELRIEITHENAEKVAQLIRELAQLETMNTTAAGIKTKAAPTLSTTVTPHHYLTPPPELGDLESGRILQTPAGLYVGSWGQFNSFFPWKAVLRILSHMIKDNSGKAVTLEELVSKSKEVFELTGLSRYRGFPSSSKESAVGRLVWHFITPAHEMGLIKIDGGNEIPVRGWGKVHISPTKEGLEFAKLNNPIFDEGETEQILSDAERKWVLDHLKRIDGEGYREYSFLKEIFDELEKGNTDIASWLENNQRFITYVKSWSRKAGDEKKFKKQVTNLAAMFAQSKIALLRELGVISDRRNDYTVIGVWE